MKFRLVDRIISWTPYERIRGVKTVSFEEYSLREPLGEEARLPESLLLESFLQLGNWLIMLSSDFAQMGMVIRLSEVQFHGSLTPGQQVDMEVVLKRQREDGFELSGEGRVQGRIVVSGKDCLAAPVPAQDYVSPEDMRVLFAEIYQPET